MLVDLDRRKTEPYLAFPIENRKIDCYRGLTVLNRIYHKYHPGPPETELVDFQTSQGVPRLSSRFVGPVTIISLSLSRQNRGNLSQ